MARNFKEALRHRRTYYHITNSSPISDEQIKEIIDFAVMNVPSAFNSQSTRIVLLLGKNHKRLWEITKETLKRLVSAEVFKGTEAKIDGSLAAGYGTILFFEDASLKHYNPLIDETVCAEWKLDPKWELVAQMPFGTPTEEPGPKVIKPLDKRVLVFK